MSEPYHKRKPDTTVSMYFRCPPSRSVRLTGQYTISQRPSCITGSGKDADSERPLNRHLATAVRMVRSGRPRTTPPISKISSMINHQQTPMKYHDHPITNLLLHQQPSLSLTASSTPSSPIRARFDYMFLQPQLKSQSL